VQVVAHSSRVVAAFVAFALSVRIVRLSERQFEKSYSPMPGGITGPVGLAGGRKLTEGTIDEEADGIIVV
jgi:hypothetical protein